MSDVLAVKPQSPALAWGTASGVVLLALGGFILSFNALRDLAVNSGIIAGLAWIWPLIVDGFIVVATAAAFALKRRGRRVTWYPWSALLLFSAVSVAGNASHAINAPGISVPVWVATVVSSVPAVALLIASHLLVVMIDGKSAPRSAVKRRPSTAKETPAPAAHQPVERPQKAAVVPAQDLPTLPRLRALEEAATVGPVSLVERLAQVVDEGGQVTGALIAEIEGVSDRTGRRRVAELRESNPELFEDIESVPAGVAQ